MCKRCRRKRLGGGLPQQVLTRAPSSQTITVFLGRQNVWQIVHGGSWPCLLGEEMCLWEAARSEARLGLGGADKIVSPSSSAWQKACEAGRNAAHHRDWKRDARKPVPTGYTSRHLSSVVKWCVQPTGVSPQSHASQATEAIATYDGRSPALHGTGNAEKACRAK